MNLLRFLALMPTGLILAASAHAVDLRFLNWEGSENALKFTNKGTTVAISASENSLSPVYVFEGPGPLELFKEVVRKDKTMREPACTLEVPPALTHAIVVLTATDQSLQTYTGVWIDDSPLTRPAGTIKLLNLSHQQVVLKMNSTEFTLAPSESHQVTLSQKKNRIVVEAEAHVDGSKEHIINNPIAMRPGLRLLLVLRDGRPQQGSKTNLVDILSFYDRPPAPPETTNRDAPR